MFNVIIVDNNVYYARKLMSYINENEEIKVTQIAINGEEALDLLNNRNDIDMFLLDIKMPKYNGIEVLNRIDKAKRETYKETYN